MSRLRGRVFVVLGLVAQAIVAGPACRVPRGGMRYYFPAAVPAYASLHGNMLILNIYSKVVRPPGTLVPAPRSIPSPRHFLQGDSP